MRFSMGTTTSSLPLLIISILCLSGLSNCMLSQQEEFFLDSVKLDVDDNEEGDLYRLEARAEERKFVQEDEHKDLKKVRNELKARAKNSGSFRRATKDAASKIAEPNPVHAIAPIDESAPRAHDFAKKIEEEEYYYDDDGDEDEDRARTRMRNREALRGDLE